MIPFTSAELAAMFYYNKRTGLLRWRTRPSQAVVAGDVAGSLHPQGYVMVQVRGKIYAAHRLVWKLVHGVEPDTVDHVNGSKADNRITNLRSVSHAENLQRKRKTRSDSTTGLLGVSYRADCNKYQAKLRRNGITEHLGTFATPEAAHAAYVLAKHGDQRMKK